MEDWKDEFAAQVPDERLVSAVPENRQFGESHPAENPWEDRPFEIDDSRAAAVLAEIDRLQQKKANWAQRS